MPTFGIYIGESHKTIIFSLSLTERVNWRKWSVNPKRMQKLTKYINISSTFYITINFVIQLSKNLLRGWD